MNFKAFLICEDVRVEARGTLTLVGVHNDRLIADAGEGEIVLPGLAFVAVIAGVRGVERIGFRQRLWRIEDAEPELLPMAFEAHQPAMDEHNFVWSQTPMVFPRAGSYEIAVDVEAGGELVSCRYRFHIERRTMNVERRAPEPR